MTTPPKRGRGRPRVGAPEPIREVPPREDEERAPRRASVHHQVRLGEGQREAIKDHADRLVMSGNAVLRAAAARLLSGDIPAPTDPKQIPPPLPSKGGEWSWIPGPQQIEQLTALGVKLRAVLLPEGPAGPGPRGGRPGKPETEARDALIRWALAQHLNPADGR